MKKHFVCGTILLALVAFMLGGVRANAQSTPTPTATPTPAPDCSISTYNSQPVVCLTGFQYPLPSVLGVSGGNIKSVKIGKKGVTCCPGTLGAVVQKSNGKLFVLGSNHVLARNSSALGSASIGEGIVQPSLPDLGCWQDSTDIVARLSSWSPINFSGKNRMDAAIAQIVKASDSPDGTPTLGINTQGYIDNIGYISTVPFPRDALHDGMSVMKMGRTSCLTQGVIDAFDARGKVVYRKACNGASAGTATFVHQILVLGQVPNQPGLCTFASTGDSGALVVTKNPDFVCQRAIGIVFAGASGAEADSGGEIVAVNPIQPILKKFNVSLVTNPKYCPTAAIVNPGAVEGRTNQAAPIDNALRASIEYARAAVKAYGPSLLAMRQVVAVGIGAGDTSDSASLKVYLTKDTPKIRRKIRAEVSGENVTFRDLSGKFHTL